MKRLLIFALISCMSLVSSCKRNYNPEKVNYESQIDALLACIEYASQKVEEMRNEAKADGYGLLAEDEYENRIPFQIQCRRKEESLPTSRYSYYLPFLHILVIPKGEKIDIFTGKDGVIRPFRAMPGTLDVVNLDGYLEPFNFKRSYDPNQDNTVQGMRRLQDENVGSVVFTKEFRKVRDALGIDQSP